LKRYLINSAKTFSVVVYWIGEKKDQL